MGTVEVRKGASVCSVLLLQCLKFPVNGDKMCHFLTIGCLLSCSPELQALLMNQLTVKVRVRGGANTPLGVKP